MREVTGVLINLGAQIKLIAIPSTFTADEKNLMLRTYKIGLIARACATFSITDIGIYYDPDPYFDSHGLGRFIVKILKYINTPPYLRKIAFEIDESLRYIGVTEPLKAPHHLDKEYPVPYRYMYLKRDLGETVILTDGERKIKVVKNEFFKPKEKIFVVDLERGEIVDKRTLPLYYGYDVFYFNKGLRVLLERLRKRGFIIIGTSRYGEDVREIEIKKHEKVAVIFGSPFRGLREMLGKDYANYFDYYINLVPNQTVKTIRTEEALFYALGILRYLNVL